MSRPLCIHHHPCADGFTSAWVVNKFFSGGVDFHPGVYGEAPPDVAGRDVILVDFSYKRPVLESMLQSGDAHQAMSILILDHHKTAAEDMVGIETPAAGIESVTAPTRYLPEHWRTAWEQEMRWPVRAEFDMARSGAQMTWDFFFGGSRPKIVNYVADRDLWQFKLPYSREIAATLFSHEYTFEQWQALAEQMEITAEFDSLVQQGSAIERKHKKDIAELLKQTQRTMKIGGVIVPVANLPYTMASDAAGHLAQTAPFGACYFDRGDGLRQFSLRSRGDNGEDVSAIAKAYGGGGHKNAAGFQMPLGWEGDLL